jgi:hypothetical protein
MANIYRNLLETIKLSRRVSNSQSTQLPGFDSMIDPIYGTEEPVDMLEYAAGTNRAVAIGDSAFGLCEFGICGWIAIIIAILFLVSLILQSLMPLFSAIPPRVLPNAADAIREAPSEESLRDLSTVVQEQQKTPVTSGIQLTPRQRLDKGIMEHEGAFPEMLPDNRPSLEADPTTEPASSFDEAALKKERYEAITGGDTIRYNQLIEEHRALYKQFGVDPCKSGFFPEGCE